MPPYRLPAATRVGGVRLQVASLSRSIEYYTSVLGLRVRSQSASTASLGAADTPEALVTLFERPGARAASRHARLGLYHFAILLPTRADLGRFIAHLRDLRVRAGSSNHLVSEALYLTDPDGLGIEVYADRPRSEWRMNGPDLAMDSLPLDFDSLFEAAGETTWAGMPSGTVMGHIHLHVGDLGDAEVFFGEALGMDVMVRGYPGALFLSAGGYHHHLGTNTWAGASAPRPTDDDARLLEWRIELPHAEDLPALVANIERAGLAVASEGGSHRLTDPWGTSLLVTTSGT